LPPPRFPIRPPCGSHNSGVSAAEASHARRILHCAILYTVRIIARGLCGGPYSIRVLRLRQVTRADEGGRQPAGGAARDAPASEAGAVPQKSEYLGPWLPGHGAGVGSGGSGAGAGPQQVMPLSSHLILSTLSSHLIAPHLGTLCSREQRRASLREASAAQASAHHHHAEKYAPHVHFDLSTVTPDGGKR
jgi:hypothetical protein